MKQPLISVITVTYNAAEAIKPTVESIIDKMQDGDFEYLIIDGGSSDDTLAVLRTYQDKVTALVSEPDKGIPDALNKGLRLAKGKYILFILAGDLLNTLPHEQLRNSLADVVCFPVEVTGGIVHYPGVNSWLKIKNTIPHQGAFFKREKHLTYDLSYRFFSDFDLCQRYFKDGRLFQLFKEPVVAFHGLDGATSNKKNFHEVFTITRNNYGRWYRLLSFIYWKLDGLMRRLSLRKG